MTHHKAAPRSENVKFQPDRVAVIVGKQPRAGLQAMVDRMTVWAPALPHYQQIAKGLREIRADAPVTLFKSDDSLSPEEEFTALIATIDLHHDEYSSDPWTLLEVYGAALTDEISVSLRKHGADRIMPTADGFRALRVVRQT